MIGNDIIDLELTRTESNWKRRGILQKLFTQAEQSQILSAEYPEICFWKLWSQKEAIYKIINRQTGKRGLIAYQINCAPSNDNFGSGIYTNNIFYTNTQITSEYIHTIAVTDLHHLQNAVVLPNRELVIKKGSIPFCKITDDPISISHHGRFEKIVLFATDPI